jgi:hypothetical protein
MSVSGISSSSAVVTHAPPPVQPHQQAKASLKAPATDTVTISKQAQQLASDGDTQAQEVRENGAERASETVRGRA